jgi:hypothetical protein
MTVAYEIVRSDRKSIGITVERDRRVIVRAPKRASETAIVLAIRRKKLWIWRKVRHPLKYPVPATHKEFVNGETFLLLGQHYELDLVDRDNPPISLVGRCLQIAQHRREDAHRLFRAWYLSQAKRELPTRIRRIATEMGVTYSRICIRDVRFRWGSCSAAGTLTFNWRAVQAPGIVIDYLIVHELAHLLESNHSEEFWNIVAVHSPSWAKARLWLKMNGPLLEW